jgi:altronate hydrolase
MTPTTEILGYLRSDGRKGIRNLIVVAYLVECAHHVAREIAHPFRERGVHLIGFSGCYPNEYAARMMRQICTHPNVGGVLLVSLGCESFDRLGLAETIRDSGRPVETLVIQQAGGTRKTVEQGRVWIASALSAVEATTRRPMSINELVVGTVCGGSDASSGLTANPAIGCAFDLLVAQRATAIFEETG